ncbi:MAG TPA: GAP family protein [Acidimicrobiales bacterium]|nr:GAP family protein [Acidimicrobiales bacterium]
MAFNLVLIGLAMALYPVALTIFILLVASNRGRRKGAAFIVGWLATLATVAAVTVAATGNTPPAASTAPATVIVVAKIVLGLVLLGVAARQRRRMGRPRPAKQEPAWRARLDEMSAMFAVGLGAFFQPTVLVVSAATIITGAKLSTAASYVALAVFGLLSVSTFVSMEIYVVVRPAGSAEALHRLDGWIHEHTDLLVIVGATALGLWLIGNNAYALAT